MAESQNIEYKESWKDEYLLHLNSQRTGGIERKAPQDMVFFETY